MIVNKLCSVQHVVHATTPLSLRNILGLGRVLDQRSRERLRVMTTGNESSKITAPRDITLSRRSKYAKQNSEANGVYFRISTDKGGPARNPRKPIHMLFSPEILDQYDTWTLNSIENNGFVFGPHGYCLTSTITGKRGITYFAHIEDEELEDIDPTVAEIVIPEDVNLLTLEKVVVPVSVMREVDALGVLDQYENLITLQS